MTREQFLAQRRSGIGGSDVANILGYGMWGCALSVWHDKRGTEVEEKESKHLQRGVMLEDFVASLWASERERKVRRLAMKTSPRYPWAMANIDREILLDERGPGVLEVKIPNRFTWLKYRREGLPSQYILQMQWYLWVLRRQWGAYAIFNAEEMLFADEGREPFEVKADHDLIEGIVPQLEAFWVKVENGPAPDKLDASDTRCSRCKYRPLCHGTEADAFEAGDAKWSNDPGLVQAIQQYAEIAEVAKEADAAKAEALEAIRAIAGDAKTKTPAGSCGLQAGATRISTSKIKDARPKLYQILRAKFSQTDSPSYRVFPKKGKS